MSYLLLAGAILTEVVATVSLSLSNGFTRLLPSLVVIVGYLSSFILLSFALARGLPLAIAYTIWAGVGVALVAVIGVVLLGNNLTWTQAGGIVAVVAGVTMIELGAAH
ncbi:MAG: DMT family transporter [Pseudonocardiaceae bacterium]